MDKKTYFDHDIVVIDKQYPDMFLIMERRGFEREELLKGKFVQLNIYSKQIPIPSFLFFNNTVNWHQQHFGKEGLIATTGLYIKDDEIFVEVLQSDLLQQLYRGNENFIKHRNIIQYHFGYWYKVLVDEIINYAKNNSFTKIFFPTGEQLIKETKKQINPELFLKIYNYVSTAYDCNKATIKNIEYWLVNIATIPQFPIICICHDIEENIDYSIEKEECKKYLIEMLSVEKKHGIKTTYNILGTLYNEKEQIISSYDRHAIGFHSFNHNVDDLEQLKKVREVNLQVRGYRPPQSKITTELTDYNLSYYNFEWLCCSKLNLSLQNGIAKIPIALDDYRLYNNQYTYEQWEQKILEAILKDKFIAFGTHDCYAQYWIEKYDAFLAKLKQIGHFKTCNDIANNLFLKKKIWE